MGKRRLSVQNPLKYKAASKFPLAAHSRKLEKIITGWELWHSLIENAVMHLPDILMTETRLEAAKEGMLRTGVCAAKGANVLKAPVSAVGLNVRLPDPKSSTRAHCLTRREFDVLGALLD